MPDAIDNWDITYRENAPGMPGRTYTGLLDDVMVRYSYDYAGSGFFDRIIAKNLFFEGGIYFNDGYLVNHEIARRSLMYEDSLLRCMLSTGFVRILTRESSADNLAKMPVTMAHQGNESFIRLINSSEWKLFEPVWRRIANSAIYTNTARKWPKFNMSEGFTTLIKRIFNLSPEADVTSITPREWEQIAIDFLARNPEEAGARDKFEKSCLNVLKFQNDDDGRVKMNQCMRIANQAYHYNFGLTLTASGEELKPVTVDTEFGKAFDYMLKKPDVHEVEWKELLGLPIMSLPKKFPLDHGDLLRPLVDPSSRAYTAKMIYLESLNSLFLPGSSSTERKQKLDEAGRAYREALVDLLAPTFGKVDLDAIFPDNSFSVIFGLVGDQQPHPDATDVQTCGVAVNVLNEGSGDNRSEIGRRFLKERFHVRPIDAEKHAPDSHVFRLRDLRPHIAALAFDGEAAREHCQNLQSY